MDRLQPGMVWADSGWMSVAEFYARDTCYPKDTGLFGDGIDTPVDAVVTIFFVVSTIGVLGGFVVTVILIVRLIHRTRRDRRSR